MYWTTGILGFLLLIASWVIGYTGNPGAMWSSAILGGLIIIFSIVESYSTTPHPWEHWLIGLLGLLTVVSPAIFGMHNGVGIVSIVLLGGLIAFLSNYDFNQANPLNRPL